MRRLARHELGCVRAAALAALGGGTLAGACVSSPMDLGHDNVVPVVQATVSAVADIDAGVNGALREVLGTSFQPADWLQGSFFGSEGTGTLVHLAPRRILVQLMNGGAIPVVSWPADPSQRSAADWSFAELDQIMNPILAYAGGDAGASVELQIAVVPPAITASDVDASAAFAEYCADLVRYYNVDGGFTWGDAGFQSDAGVPIEWWGIYSDPNNPGGLTAPAYQALYETVVPAMQDAAPSVHFSAFEISDYPGIDTDPASWIYAAFPTGYPLDAVSLHWFATSNYSDYDSELFAEIPAVPSNPSQQTITNDVLNLKQKLQPYFATVPIWVTQNNVNDDYPDNLMSHADPLRPFQDDPRGTSPFFAAWRPYVFSQLGKAGVEGLVHWSFASGSCPATEDAGYCTNPPPGSGIDAASLDTDIQNAEVDYTSGTTQISYWVDYELGQMFPITPTGPKILGVTSSQSSSGAPLAEILATQNDDGSMVIMAADVAPADPKDVNGNGAPIHVVLDLGALLSSAGAPSDGFADAAASSFDGGSAPAAPSFSAWLTTVDAHTDRGTGPAPVQIAAPTPANPKVTLSFGGYGVEFLQLLPQ